MLLDDCAGRPGLGEGPETGGPYGPYRQSERRAIYADVVEKLVKAGHVYESYSTPEETRLAPGGGPRPQLGYEGFDRELTEGQRAALSRGGACPCCAAHAPDDDVTWTDLIRDEITFAAAASPDFVITRATRPLYTLTNPVDDALMRITDVLRGEDAHALHAAPDRAVSRH